MEASWLDRFVAKNALKRFSIDDINKLTSELSISNLIGSGQSAKVYMGHLPDTGLRVAVKILRENVIAEEAFIAKVTTMYKTYHRHLVTVHGFCFEDTLKALVLEYVAGRSLATILYDSNHDVPLVSLYGIMIQVAKGLSYLHEDCPEQIIHHDVSPWNVLLDPNLSVKIAYFGLEKLFSTESPHFIMLKPQGTHGYVAPEKLVQFLPITCKCDVYGFGKILLAILGISINHGSTCHKVWQEVERGRLDHIITNCIADVGDRQKAKILLMIGFWCIQHRPEMRPSMRLVANMLENDVLVTIPPNPFDSETLLQLPPPSMQPS